MDVKKHPRPKSGVPRLWGQFRRARCAYDVCQFFAHTDVAKLGLWFFQAKESPWDFSEGFKKSIDIKSFWQQGQFATK